MVCVRVCVCASFSSFEMNSNCKIYLSFRYPLVLCKYIKKNKNRVVSLTCMFTIVIFFYVLSCAVPSKVYPSENITMIEGENRTLTCNVSGSPVLTVTWTEVSSRSQSNGIMRYLTNISRNNAGEYECKAINDCGNSSVRIFLTVLCK